MATYFHGSSEFQAAPAAAAAPDGMQTLYLLNPSYVPYSDTHQTAATNMLFLNPANLHHGPSQNPQLVGLPLPTTTTAVGASNSDDPTRPSVPALHGMIPGVQYNLWGSNMDQNSPGNHTQIASAGGSGGAHGMASHLGLRQPVLSPTRQGLSLSLSSQQVPFRPSRVEPADHHMQADHHQVPATISLADHELRVSGNSPSSVSVVSNGVQSVVLGSKYLRAAQELLDEVVNVGKGIKSDMCEGTKEKIIKMSKESMAVVTTGGDHQGSSGAGNGANKRAAELTTAQRQELQMKKAKLVSMLDEVEQRYRQYHHQMQIVASSFEQAAGMGTAKSYTALALQTISKQFRCLKDAIAGQIKATSKSLGEDDCLGAKAEGSRLRYVDHQLRQQRALQHLGMIQHNAWRPQRGLPERAVSVLRAWLFEHFLHPYPKDSDKIMLAKQTGLTRSQVSNWFINARVRLWKPMVEEMYVEEMKENERNGGAEENTSSKNELKEGISGSSGSGSLKIMDQVKIQSKPEKPSNMQNLSVSTEFSNSTISNSPMGASLHPHAGFNLIGSSNLEVGIGAAVRSPKKPRSNNDMQNSPSSILSMDMEMKQGEPSSREIGISKFGDDRLSKDGVGAYSLITSSTFPTMGDQIGRFNPEQQLAPRFHGNGVSLTLGLPHCENLSLSGNQQNFLSNQSIQLGRRLELGPGESDFCGINTAQASHSGAGYESMEMQNRKRFAAQLLPDFVA